METNKLTKIPKACTIWVLLQPDFLPFSFLLLWLLQSTCWLRNPKSQGLCPCSFIHSLCHFVQSLLKRHFLRKPSLTTLYQTASQLPHTMHCAHTLLLHNRSPYYLTFYSVLIFFCCYSLSLSCTSQQQVSPFQSDFLPPQPTEHFHP